METKDQLKDSGAVIGYSPTFKYEKRTDSSSQPLEYLSSKNETYTKCLNDFKKNMPSSSLIALDYAINTISKSISSLKEKYEEITGITYTTTEDMVKKNITISGNTIPEIVEILEKNLVLTNKIKDAIKILFYNDKNLTTQEVTDKDNSIKTILERYELKNEKEKINYLTLNFDAKFNKMISNFGYMLNSSIFDIVEVSYIDEKQKPSDSSKIKLNIIESMFDDVSKQYKTRQKMYNIQHSVESTQKTLYNYYHKRNILNEYYDMALACDIENSFLGKKLADFQTSVEESIKIINQSLQGSLYYNSKIAELLNEKQQIRTLYTSISNNE